MKKGCGCEVDDATGETVKFCPNGDTPAMVGKKLCGCYVAAFVVPDAKSDPQEHGEFASEMRRWARQGLERETKTVAFVRHGGLSRCPHVKRRAPFGKEKEGA